MTKNMGGMDKNLRLLAGIIIIILGFIYQSWWGLLGIPFIATSILSFCPAYFPFKFSTIKEKK